MDWALINGLKKIDYITLNEKQKEKADEAYKILSKEGLVYLNMQERSGKTLVSLDLCMRPKSVNKILVITSGLKPLAGWSDTINKCSMWFNKYINVINYHNASKEKASDYDLIIMDESHSYLAAYPKKGHYTKIIHKLTKDKPIIYCSATAMAQGIQQLFHQFHISSFSCWSKYKDFYKWYSKFAERDFNGQYYTKYVNTGRLAIDYTRISESAYDEVARYFVSGTRKEMGIEHEPSDKVHYIDVCDKFKELYNYMLKHSYLSYDGSEYVASSGAVLLIKLHMLEGGTNIDTDGVAHILKDFPIPKIDFIKETWGDSSDVAIMHNYIKEGDLLRDHFKKCLILSGNKFAQGVDLSHIKHVIIYSQNFSVAKHTQRRCRQASVNRKEPIIVNYLLIKKSVSEQAYKTVAEKKKSFVDRFYTKNDL